MEGYRPVLDCMILPCPEPTTGSLQTLEGRAVAAEGAAPPPLDHLLVWVQPGILEIAFSFRTPDEQGSGPARIKAITISRRSVITDS